MIVNSRMYSVTPASTAAWRELLSWVMARAGVGWDFVTHNPPLLLSDLWSREDLGLVQMCGLPFSRRIPQATAIVATVPSLPQYDDKSIYMSYLAVRADAPFARIEDTFGRIAGYTLKDSQSGYFAFRYFLLEHFGRDDQYAGIVGGLMNPRGIVQALADGRIDVGPLDSYVFDLIRATDPAFAAQVKIIATTDPTPMPSIVGAPNLDAATLAHLREAFMAAISEPALKACMETLLIARFIVPDPAAYGIQDARAKRVEAAPVWP
jgi:ABC-type phosphate/phosphonate transport system substrate-binding protein